MESLSCLRVEKPYLNCLCHSVSSFLYLSSLKVNFILQEVYLVDSAVSAESFHAFSLFLPFLWLHEKLFGILPRRERYLLLLLPIAIMEAAEPPDKARDSYGDRATVAHERVGCAKGLDAHQGRIAPRRVPLNTT